MEIGLDQTKKKKKNTKCLVICILCEIKKIGKYIYVYIHTIIHIYNFIII